MAVCPDNAVQYTTLQWRWFLYCNIKARTEYFFHLVAHRFLVTMSFQYAWQLPVNLTKTPQTLYTPSGSPSSTSITRPLSSDKYQVFLGDFPLGLS